MYEALEQKTLILSTGVLIAIVALGKLFGGALYGLIPLRMCVASDIYFWMKELVRKGREQEWQSEKDCGQTVRDLP